MKRVLILFLLVIAVGAGMIWLGVMPKPFFNFVNTYIPALTVVIDELGTLREGMADSVPLTANAAASISFGPSEGLEGFPAILDAVVTGVMDHNEAIEIPVIFPDGDDDSITSYYLSQVELAIDHMRRDRPDIFWMSLGAYSIEWNGNRTTREGYLTVSLNYCYTKEEAAALSEQMDAIIDAVLAEAPGDIPSTVEYIHDWMIRQTVYDAKLADGSALQGYEYGFNIDGVFIHGNAVCEGYSKAFKLLCDRAGILCESVFGIANGENHSWNYVQLDGRWYLVDATWDDPVGAEDVLVWDYFLKGRESMIDGVPVSEIYQPDYAEYPPLAQDGYYQEAEKRSLQGGSSFLRIRHG